MEQFTVREYIVREIGFHGVFKQETVGDIVRCEDCKHSFGYTTGYGLYGGLTCEELDRDVDDEFFCAYGERRDEE